LRIGAARKGRAHRSPAKMKMPHLFEQATFEHVEAITGLITASDDGIAAASAHWSRSSSGSVITVHDDLHVSAIDCRQIIDANSFPETENCRTMGRFRCLRQPEEVEDRIVCHSIFVLYTATHPTN
jgi:hypothetical protein